MAEPNWIDIEKLKGKLYIDLTSDTYDTELTDLGIQITNRMLSSLGNPSWIDVDTPPAELVRAALMQANFEWRQRETPGLNSRQFQDGSVNKYDTSEFLKEVQSVIDRNRNYTLYPTA